jgi:hypothetical protein
MGRKYDQWYGKARMDADGVEQPAILLNPNG